MADFVEDGGMQSTQSQPARRVRFAAAGLAVAVVVGVAAR
jgi:hypothetical protein